MNTRRRIRACSVIRILAPALLASALIAACERDAQAPAHAAGAELAWARAALERNPNLEVLAVDSDAAVFTVRDRATGEVQAVKLSDLAAAPASMIAAAGARRSAPDEAALASTAAPEAAPVVAPESSAEDLPAADEAPAAAPFDYTVERQGGQVRVTGPGISIVSAGPAAAPTARGEAGQRTVDPIICEGPRMMQFDHRRIFVDGDALTARAGCELHITNSRIVASGTGVVVQDATVHITNSYIEGAAGSYDAGPGARLFLRGATLNGTRRRDATAEVQDLAGGEWR